MWCMSYQWKHERLTWLEKRTEQRFVHPNNLLIILNDNDVSIDSVGGMSSAFPARLPATTRYSPAALQDIRLLFKNGTFERGHKSADSLRQQHTKSMAAQQQNIFEGMNIAAGPYQWTRCEKQPVSCGTSKTGTENTASRTVKEGFEPAEKNRYLACAPGSSIPGEPETPPRQIPTDCLPLFQDVFGKLVEHNRKIENRQVASHFLPAAL